ncbi:MAG: nicotinate (nicotinamide) nucleotide adenylyltransferase [Holophagales bacterium]|jgi:nicotinate-nucleotide adenylyltransferase|nr:nicotinate (nicotinamide) nucleotide adenylyltransferase [Holophagales bacterium]
MKRVGLLGGVFDPPHDGHLKLAWLAWEHLRLDELRFLPSFISPHKHNSAAAPEVRLYMLREMLADTPFSVDTVELELRKVSYTVNTLETLKKLEPDAAWILVMGSDQAADFAGWRNSGRILELASVSVAERPDAQAAGSFKNTAKWMDASGLSNIMFPRVRNEWSGVPGELVFLPSTDLDLASSQIRERIADGEGPVGLCEQVKHVILKEKLYR